MSHRQVHILNQRSSDVILTKDIIKWCRCCRTTCCDDIIRLAWARNKQKEWKYSDISQSNYFEDTRLQKSFFNVNFHKNNDGLGSKLLGVFKTTTSVRRTWLWKFSRFSNWCPVRNCSLIHHLHLINPSFQHSFIHPFIHSFIHLFIHSSIHPFIHSFIH